MVQEVLVMIRQMYACTEKVKKWQNHNKHVIKQDDFTYFT